MSDNSLKKGRYTRYSNKIGLYSTSQDRIGFLNNNTDVVLSFPFKDTVLEAGMSKEDSGREERFLHLEVDLNWPFQRIKDLFCIWKHAQSSL